MEHLICSRAVLDAGGGVADEFSSGPRQVPYCGICGQALHVAANLATIKHLALNPIRRAPGKDSMRLRRKIAAWDDDFLAAIISGGLTHPIPLIAFAAGEMPI